MHILEQYIAVSSYSHKEICDDIDDLEEEEICEDIEIPLHIKAVCV